MTNIGEECAPGQLWVPGMHLDTEYRVPTDAQIEVAWKEYHPSGIAQSVHGVLGVYTPPEQGVKAVASIDLCEVVRDTVGSLHAATGVKPEIAGVNFYSNGTWYDSGVKGNDYEASVVTSVIQVLMGEGHVQPVAEIRPIQTLLKRWREQGIFTVANTSTLPGCELSTIKYTLGRDLPDSFDALILPRNHDGTGKITKARALAILAAEASIDLTAIPFIHIDDASHHITGFQDHYRDHEVQLFVPKHAANTHIAKELHCETPLEAFERANRYFVEQGVINAR